MTGMDEDLPTNDPIAEAAFRAGMEAPVTRAELIQALHLIHLALISQSIVTYALIEGDEDARRHAAKAIEHAGSITEFTRKILNKAKAHIGDTEDG